MFKLFAPLLGAFALATAPASAAVVSYVSSKGIDAGTCAAAATPCRLFSYALGQTSSGGEIKVLDAGNYGALVINKSITITGVDGAGVVSGAPTLISVNPGSTGVVNLTNLTLDGVRRTAANGIVVLSGTAVSIKNCTIRNFSARGISIETTVLGFVFSIEDTVVSSVGAAGIHVEPPSYETTGSINRVTVSRANEGIILGITARVNINSSMISDNAGPGIRLKGNLLYLNNTSITRNKPGLLNENGGAFSAGNNFIFNNIDGNLWGNLNTFGMQ